MADVERERVGRFDWERLMLSSDLPWPTKAVLLALGVFMSADGGRARPGLAGLADITGLSPRAIRGHLSTAVDQGYLGLLSRGGYRGGRRGGAGVARASVYAATVPKYIFEVGAEILMSRPWRRNEPEADDRFIPDEVGRQTATGGAADGHPQGMNRQSSANEPAIQRNEPEAGFPLSRSAHHVLEDHVIASASRSVATPFGRRNATAMQTINEATVRRENGIVRKLVMDHTRIEYDAADLLVRWLRANRPNVRDLIAYVQKLIDDNAIEPLLQCADVWDEAS